MAADDYTERTEQPTSLRLAEARRRGQVPRSADLTAAALLLAAVLLTGLLGGRLLGGLTDLTAAMLDGRAVPAASAGESAAALWGHLGPVLSAAVVLMLSLAAAAALAGFVQVGPLLTTDPLAARADRLSPAAGLRRILSSRTAVRAGMAAAKIAAAAVVGYVVIAGALSGIVGLAGCEPAAMGPRVGRLLFDLGVRLAGVLLAVGIVDWLYQRWQHRRDLRMTRREVLEDLRRMEGDAEVRRRRRDVRGAAHPATSACQADVVIAAEGGAAVAVKYAPAAGVPRVTARGAGAAAQRMVAAAQGAGVPVVFRGPLAHKLYRWCPVGWQVPRVAYEEVAEVLAQTLAARSPMAGGRSEQGGTNV